MELLGSLGAALLGAVIGVIGQAMWTREVSKAETRNRRKSAALLVDAELQLASYTLRSSLDAGNVIALEVLSIRAWEKHGWELTSLDSTTFETVSIACTQLDGLIASARVIGSTDRPASANNTVIGDGTALDHAIRQVLCNVDEAINVLGAVAHPDMEPPRIWPPPESKRATTAS